MHLYVWTDVLSNWGEGIAFALASSPEEARELVINSVCGEGAHPDTRAEYTAEFAKEPEEYSEPVAFHQYGSD